MLGEARDLFERERWHRRANRQAIIAGSGETEHHESFERSNEGIRSSIVPPEAERGGRGGEIDGATLRMFGQSDGQPSQEPGCRRAEGAEPESLDVVTECVMAQAFDDGVVPAHDVQ